MGAQVGAIVLKRFLIMKDSFDCVCTPSIYPPQVPNLLERVMELMELIPSADALALISRVPTLVDAPLEEIEVCACV